MKINKKLNILYFTFTLYFNEADIFSFTVKSFVHDINCFCFQLLDPALSSPLPLSFMFVSNIYLL